MDRCPFYPSEIETLRKFDSHDWVNDGNFVRELAGRSGQETELDTKIKVFTSIYPDISADKLKIWANSKGTGFHASTNNDDKDELFKAFKTHDFTTDAKFQEFVKEKFQKDGTKSAGNALGLDKNLLSIKAEYYSLTAKRPIDLDEFKKWEEKQNPAQACPYAHLWNPNTNKKIDAEKKYPHISVVDLAKVTDNAEALDQKHMSSIQDHFQKAMEDENINAVFIHRTYTDNELLPTDNWFLPPLATTASTPEEIKASKAVYAAFIHLVLIARRLAVQKPLVVLANGKIDRSTLALALAGRDFVVTENFSVKMDNALFPFSPLFELSHLHRLKEGQVKGTMSYLTHHPTLVIRAPEALSVGLAQSFIPANLSNSLLEDMFVSSACPPPHSGRAVRSTYLSQTAYPGPSKLSPWNEEIETYFSPLCDGKYSIQELCDTLGEIDKPWSQTYSQGVRKLPAVLVEMKHRAFIGSQNNPFHQCLMDEYRNTTTWWSTEDCAALLLSKKESNKPAAKASDQRVVANLVNALLEPTKDLTLDDIIPN
ncbi:hypothetical protein H4219_002437 [Mycoemilia scoparia]|uniref:PEX14-like helix-turn-helix domain-containing protein n=1 Tax=Mycoemilia scoparia TaxID=417184 RepID=A0A9W7ZXK4_9FUNG|nr:hypothetical protein H4219_002437 [Mycoemilia scoparia]